MHKLLLVLGCVGLFSCHSAKTTQPSAIGNTERVSRDTTQTLTTIAFGSCNRTTLPQPLWNDIIQQQPDLWIWLGDNIYGDTTDMDVMRQIYQDQLQQSDYQELLETTQVVGIWDDHDYGINDGGKFFTQKKASRNLLLEFLHVDSSRPVWKREGAYQAYTFGPEGKQVKVILLDTRYFRDTLERTTGENRRYLPNREGDILGAAQWSWLTQELNNSDAQLNIIGSSIQTIAEDHRFEKWANFPRARQRLFDLIADSKAHGVMLLSGDRHIGEISRLKLTNMPYPLYDITSSGLTHVYEKADEENQHRVSELVASLNYGLIQINWQPQSVEVTYQIKGDKDATYATETVVYPLRE